MANRNPLREHDPATRRLTSDQVVQIHLAHRAGEGWNSIADRFGTKWKNISRIINGERWPELHPSRRPDLYTDPTDTRLAEVNDALTEIEQRIQTIRTVLNR